MVKEVNVSELDGDLMTCVLGASAFYETKKIVEHSEIRWSPVFTEDIQMVIMIYALWRRDRNSDRPWLRRWANGLYATADAIVCWGLLLVQAQLIKACLL